MKYEHLVNNPKPLPWIISEGMKLIGITEIVGPKHNEDIMGWAKELSIGVYTKDEIPWCGLYVAIVCKYAKKGIISGPLWARNWLKWGVGVAKNEAGLGDILVFERGSGGHVGLYIAEDKTCYHVLGGNQGNKVSITRVAKNRLLGARRAKYNNVPITVKPYLVASNGTISQNEA